MDYWLGHRPWYRRVQFWVTTRFLDVVCRVRGHTPKNFGPAASPWLICERCGLDVSP